MIDIQLVEDLTAYRQAMPDVRRLFEEVFVREFPSGIWDQWYFKNPYGSPMVVMGFSGGRAVAHQAFIPQRLTDAQGTVLPYVLSISSMVHSECRSWTVFNRMMALLHETASRHGYSLILALPNAKACELYRVLFRYRTLTETPLCTWIPNSAAGSAKMPLGETQSVCPEAFSYPADSTYWAWRASVNQARYLDLTDSTRIAAKVSGDGVLTVLDVLGSSCPDGGERLSALAKSLGVASIRLTALHANALGIAEQNLVSHENYTVRLMCRMAAEYTPDIRFSLLLSDAF
jgi:hypothetical protein